MSRPSAIIPVPGKHTASLIFLHGLGDVGESWLEEFKMNNIPKKFPYVKFIFPTAGGAVALHTALTSPHTLGGLLALSTWLPLMATFPEALIAGDKKVNLPILHCHGNKDSIVRMYWGRLSEESIKAMGFKQHVFKEYDNMVHEFYNQEMKDVIAFIEQHLPKTD